MTVAFDKCDGLAQQVVEDHQKVVKDDDHEEDDCNCADRETMGRVEDDATEANQSAQEDVQGHLIKEVLLVGQPVIPLGFHHYDYKHGEAGPNQEENS